MNAKKALFLDRDGVIKEGWNTLDNLRGIPIDLVISVDSARKDTYEALRLGGTWERLKENLQYISSLRKQGEIQKLTLNFLVQKENYDQLEEFVEFARSWDVDMIEFQRMANWGTFDDDSFDTNDVLNPTNPLCQDVLVRLRQIIDQTKDILITNNIFEEPITEGEDCAGKTKKNPVYLTYR